MTEPVETPETTDLEQLGAYAIQSQAELDKEEWTVTYASVEHYLERTAPLTDKSPVKMIKDIRRLGKGAGQLKYPEYFRWRLYEKSRSEQTTFLSEWEHWPIENAINDQEAAATTVAKWECTDLLEQAGLTTIPVAAMVDADGGDYGTTPTLTNADALRGFLNEATLPLFAKPNALLASYGAFRIDTFDDDQIALSDGRTFTPEEMFHGLMGNEAYLLQQVVQNHAEIREWAPNLATMRTMNFMLPSGLYTQFAIYKIPCNGNIADNFWRTGNLLAEVDVATGEIVRVVRDAGADQITLTNHPDTGQPLVGTFIPHWEATMDLNVATAHRFETVRYSTLDLAITDGGPVVVEVNAGGSFDLPQVATGRGMLELEVKNFMKSCGHKFGT